MMLNAADLKLVYRDGGADVAAVAGVSISIAPREFVGIVGPSGSGKSSLLYLLALLKTPSEGGVEFEGNPVSRLDPDDRASLRRRRFGFVFQNPFLIGYLTAIENVLCIAPEAEARAAGLLDELSIGHCRDKYPHQMSMGERQRVAIARSVIHRPSIVFADEPTAALDRMSADQAVDCLRHCTKDGALFVVTHDETILKGANRVMRMEAGRLK